MNGGAMHNLAGYDGDDAGCTLTVSSAKHSAAK